MRGKAIVVILAVVGVVAVGAAGFVLLLPDHPMRAGVTADDSTRAPSGAALALQRLAFVAREGGDDEIYTISADGSARTNLTHSFGSDTAPAWSPDGRRIAFVSNRDGNSEIYVMNADGSAQRNLTNDPRQDSSPSWSPDGTRIVFERSEECDPARVNVVACDNDMYVMNADGSGLRRVTSNFQGGACPSWSADGVHIGFFREHAIHVIKRNGWITPVAWDAGDLGGCPVWSPDGKLLAYASTDRDGVSGIFVTNADGSERRYFSYPSALTAYASWSPDGKSLSYWGVETDGRRGLYVIGADGSKRTRIVETVALQVMRAAWGPDGRHIAFTICSDTCRLDLVDIDGAHRTTLTALAGYDFAWQPVVAAA